MTIPRRAPLKNYYYTGDDGATYLLTAAEYLGGAAGLKEIPQEVSRPANAVTALNNPRYVWAKEAVPSSRGTMKRVKLVVQPDSHFYRASCRYPVYINDKLYETTGRVGESVTWGADRLLIEKLLNEEWTKVNEAQAIPMRTVKWFFYTGDDGKTYLHNAAEYLGIASGLEEVQEQGLSVHQKYGHVGSTLNNPRYVWAKEAVPSKPGYTRRVQLVVEVGSPLYRTIKSLPIKINGELYVTTGRVGESMTFGRQSTELSEELQKLTRIE